MVEIQSFLNDFHAFRAHCDQVDYMGVENPYDGVFYPGVSLDISDSIQAEVKEKIEHAEGGGINIHAMFLRLSVKGVDAPHQAHTDTVMGDKSFMLYLNKEEDCQGGTALVQHKNGMYREPSCSQSRDVWVRDHSNPDAWKVNQMCKMEENKGCIFDARLMHRAEPIGGFGDNSINGRLVLTAFFSRVEH